MFFLELMQLSLDRLGSAGWLGQSKDVAATGREDAVMALGIEILPGFFGLFEVQAVDANLGWLALQQLATHGHSDQAGATEDEDLAVADVHDRIPWKRKRALRNGPDRVRRSRYTPLQGGALVYSILVLFLSRRGLRQRFHHGGWCGWPSVLSLRPNSG